MEIEPIQRLGPKRKFYKYPTECKMNKLFRFIMRISRQAKRHLQKGKVVTDMDNDRHDMMRRFNVHYIN